MSMEPTAADASLSGHEWHKKQAGEGKELYIYPGKSLENLMAPKKKAEGQDVTLKQAAFPKIPARQEDDPLTVRHHQSGS